MHAFRVQYVINQRNSNEFHDYRGYGGRLAGGIFRKGDKVTVLPSGFSSSIQSINILDGRTRSGLQSADENLVAITLADDIDISRGDMIVRENNLPQTGQDIEAMIC